MAMDGSIFLKSERKKSGIGKASVRTVGCRWSRGKQAKGNRENMRHPAFPRAAWPPTPIAVLPGARPCLTSLFGWEAVIHGDMAAYEKTKTGVGVFLNLFTVSK